MENEPEKTDAEKHASYVLGVDIGTGSLKAMTAGPDGNFPDIARYAYPLVQPEKDFFEQDPEATVLFDILELKWSETAGLPVPPTGTIFYQDKGDHAIYQTMLPNVLPIVRTKMLGF